jgi:uncharacterized membrane protein
MNTAIERLRSQSGYQAARTVLEVVAALGIVTGVAASITGIVLLSSQLAALHTNMTELLIGIAAVPVGAFTAVLAVAIKQCASAVLDGADALVDLTTRGQ